MGSVVRLVFIGDDEGEIDLFNFLKAGWEVHFGSDGKLLIKDGMVVVYKPSKINQLI